MFSCHLAFADTFCPGCTDIILVQGLQHTGTCHTGNDGHGIQTQGHCRKYHMYDSVLQSYRISLDDTVNDHKTCHCVRAQRRVNTSAGRQPVKDAGKQDDQHDSEPENRHRYTDQGQQHTSVIKYGVLLHRRHHADNNTENSCQDDRYNSQLHCCRKTAGNLFCHRCFCIIGSSQITGDCSFDKINILCDHRFIQPIGFTPFLHALPGCVLTQNDRRRVRCAYTHKKEHNQGYTEENGYEL